MQESRLDFPSEAVEKHVSFTKRSKRSQSPSENSPRGPQLFTNAKKFKVPLRSEGPSFVFFPPKEANSTT
jgi:hypothetical protein